MVPLYACFVGDDMTSNSLCLPSVDLHGVDLCNKTGAVGYCENLTLMHLFNLNYAVNNDISMKLTKSTRISTFKSKLC